MTQNGMQNGTGNGAGPIRLHELTDVAGSIELVPGEVHEVRSPDADVYELLQQAKQAEVGDFMRILAVYDAVGLLVPTADRSQIRKLSHSKLALIIAVANGQVERVDELAGELGLKKRQPTETAAPTPPAAAST